MDRKYIELLKEYNIDLKIVCVNDSSFPVQEIIEKENQVEIRLNMSVISEEEYETYLSYNVRKVLLPMLKLVTERLIIRRVEEKDADCLFEFWKDKESCYLDGGYEPMLEKDEEYYESIKEMIGEETRYVVSLKETDEAIGMIHLMPRDDRAVETMEIGYTINPSKRRCGYAMEAVETILEYLLNVLHLDMVIAGVVEENVPSLKMLEKLGFMSEGRKHKALYHCMQGPIDLLYFYKERESL